MTKEWDLALQNAVGFFPLSIIHLDEWQGMAEQRAAVLLGLTPQQGSNEWEA